MRAGFVLAVAMLGTIAATGGVQAQRVAAAADTLQAFSGEASALQRPAHLEVKRVPLNVALTELSDRSGVAIAFSPSRLAMEGPVDCDCLQLTVTQALDRLLAATAYRYAEVDGHVVVIPQPAPRPAPLRRVLRPRAPAYAMLSRPVSVNPTPPLTVRQELVAGTVVDASTGRPIATAQVTALGTNLGTVTDADGRFRIDGFEGAEVTLRVELIGYRTVTRTVPSGTTDVRIELGQTAISLDAVVVTGTAGGAQRRAIGNVVETIDADEVLATAPIQSVQQLLSQRTTGMLQLPSAGQVGTGSPIRLRGVNSMSLRNGPLVYIDGIRMESDPRAGPGTRGGARINRLNDLNPQDIASIEVIKGPSAATLYGTEASNGVIQIITKKGSEGPTQWDVAVRFGTNWLWNPEGRTPTRWRRNPDTAELEGFNILTEERLNGGGPVFEYGSQQGYDLSLSGGNEAVRYFTSGSWYDETGVVGYDFHKRLNLRANLELLLTDNLSVTTTTAYMQNSTRLAQNTGGFGAEPFSNVIWNFPATLDNPQRGWFVAPPEEWGKVRTMGENDRTIASLQARHNPVEWFSHRLSLGLDLNKEENSVLWPRQAEGASHFWGANGLGIREVERVDRRQLTVDYSASATYQQSPDLALTTSAGFQYVKGESSAIEAEGSEFPAIPITTVTGGTERDGSESFTENATLGLYIQEQLSWRDRLFLTGAVRGDDNSAFGVNFDAAIYPKASATWVVHEEPFWNVGWIDQFRLRTAWGAAGQQPGTFDAPRLYDPEIGFRDQPALVPSSFGNPELKPERSQELEFGFDLSLLDDRLDIVFTRYERWIDDAIVQRPLSPSTGFSGSQIVNLGSVRGWGNELGINARAIEGSDFAWDLGLQISTNQNRIDDLGPGLDFVNAGTQQENVVSFPIGSYFFRHILSAEIDADGNVTEGGKIPS